MALLVKDMTNSTKDFILKDVKIEIHKRSILMRLLKTAGVEWHRKAVDGICQHTAKNALSLSALGKKDINWPDGIAFATAEFHKEHLASNELIHFGPLKRTV